jgi:cytochrome c peroxidase
MFSIQPLFRLRQAIRYLRGIRAFAAALMLMLVVVIVSMLPHRPAGAQADAAGGNVIDSLKKLPVPAPPPAELALYIKDKNAAIQLGKALFWDVRVSSDHRVACASCHFSAGADNRIRNQLGPGLLAGDRSFQLGGPNYTLKASDFPLTRHADINDAASRYADINDVVSSQGVQTARFMKILPDATQDKCAAVSDAVFHGGTGFNINGANTRRVEPRNAPSVINAVFNFRNFWDGRANNIFNGGDPFGLRNDTAMVWKIENGVLRQTAIALSSSALASLSSGPPASRDEMSCLGRNFANLGRKLVDTYFLSDQRIDASDSTLAPWADKRTTYAALIRQAFRPEFWNSPQIIRLAQDENEPARTQDLAPTRPGMGRSTGSGKMPDDDLANDKAFGNGRPAGGNRYTQMEANFALFFGLAVQLYQSTLVADDSPFDRFMDGNADALSGQQKRGLAIFTGVGNCFLCHSGPALSSASYANVMNAGRLDSRTGTDNTVFRFDTGFFNIGVRPTTDDPGLGGTDPFGYPLSETRMSQLGKSNLLGNQFDPQKEGSVAPNARTLIDGAFKTPGLRNVEFTGPYFHNGGKATLMQVVDFYNRGGDFVRENAPSTVLPIQPLGLTQTQKEDLVAFLLSLSDERVRYARAPFDHPSICVPDGHEGDHLKVKADRAGQAIDRFRCIDAVGANGSRVPAARFLDLSAYQR